MAELEMSEEDIKKYWEIRKTYKEYRQLRRRLGRPSRAFDDKEGILEDLTGKGFSGLQEDIGKYKKQKTKTGR